jgi:hypothetical protein
LADLEKSTSSQLQLARRAQAPEQKNQRRADDGYENPQRHEKPQAGDRIR